jgi:hypothetical protein
VDWGEENWTPGVVVAPSGVTNNYPYYPGKGRVNSPSENQISIDYIGDSYTYPVGIYEYQYYAYGATANPGDTFNDGNPGSVYGAGGGGASSYNNTECSGGNGAKGLIRITYYY